MGGDRTEGQALRDMGYKPKEFRLHLWAPVSFLELTMWSDGVILEANGQKAIVVVIQVTEKGLWPKRSG